MENAFEPHQLQDWGNTYTKQGAKVLNKKVQQALEKTIDLRAIAQRALARPWRIEKLKMAGLFKENPAACRRTPFSETVR